MSLDATRWAWMQNIKPASTKLVLLSMADRADEQCHCYPSIERLISDTGLDRKTIHKAITSLIESGRIEDTGERKGCTGRVKVYRLIGVPLREEIGPKTESFQKRNHSDIPNETGPKTERLNRPKNGTLNLPEATNQEGTTKRKEKRTPQTPHDKTELPAWLDPKAWQDWLDHRRETKYPVTPVAARRAINELARLREQGHDPAKVIDHSILNGWRGLFPPKPEHKPNGSRDPFAPSQAQVHAGAWWNR